MSLFLQLVSNTLLTGVVVAAVTAYFKSRAPYVELEAKYWDEQLREEARVHSDYIRPLSGATRDLLERLRQFKDALGDGARPGEKQRLDNLREFVMRLKNGEDKESRNDPKGYLSFCNGDGVDGVDAMYVLGRYFALATKTRAALPTIEWALRKRCEDLRQALAATEAALGGEFGVYEAIQRSIGQYLLKEDGRPKEYAAFCELLAGQTTHTHFLKLFDFLIDLAPKLNYQIAGALTALPDVESSLARLSEERSPLTEQHRDRPRSLAWASRAPELQLPLPRGGEPDRQG